VLIGWIVLVVAGLGVLGLLTRSVWRKAQALRADLAALQAAGRPTATSDRQSSPLTPPMA
jgi:Tfp pilus assembly protein PilV